MQNQNTFSSASQGRGFLWVAMSMQTLLLLGIVWYIASSMFSILSSNAQWANNPYLTLLTPFLMLLFLVFVAVAMFRLSKLGLWLAWVEGIVLILFGVYGLGTFLGVTRSGGWQYGLMLYGALIVIGGVLLFSYHSAVRLLRRA